jgi:hypothetical protein
MIKLRLLVGPAAAALAVVALPAATAAAIEPQSGSCSAQAAVRVLSDRPSCAISVACPSTATNGCFFAAQIEATALGTIATAQARLRIRDLSIPDPEVFTDFFCSAPAAIVATGEGSSCSTSASAFLDAGRRFRTECAWTGQTISVRANVTCSASFTPNRF